MSLRPILIVEPNPGILIVGRNVLARAGFSVTAVATVDDGLLHVRRHPIDVVLLDARAADPEVLIAFAGGTARTVPIILTVQKGRDATTTADLVEDGPVEITDVIEKPFVAERLLLAVERAVQRASEQTDPRIHLDLLEHPTHDEPDMQRTDRFQIDLGAYASAGAIVGGVHHTATAAAHELEEVEKTMPFEALLETSHGADLARVDLTERRIELPPGLGWRDPRRVTTRFARLTARLRAALSEQELRLDPSEMVGLVHACDAALAEEASLEQAEPSQGGELALSGRLEYLPIDQLLQLAATVAQPTRCRLEQDGQAIEIFFRGGQVVFARQDNMPEGFTLGRVLAASGFVHERDVERWLAHTRRPSSVNGRTMPARIGQRLVQAGVIRPRDLEDGLRRQIEELVFEAVRWSHGRFQVFAKEPLPAEAEEAGLSFPMHHLLLEGMRRLDELQRMAREVGDVRAVLGRAEAAVLAEVLDSLHPEERMLLEQVDGHRTVEDLVRSARLPAFDVFRALQQLRGRRLVTVVPPFVQA